MLELLFNTLIYLLSSPPQLIPLISTFRTYLCLFLLFLSAALGTNSHFLVHSGKVLITFNNHLDSAI